MLNNAKKCGGERDINSKLVAGLFVLILLVGIGSFAFEHSASATPTKKTLNKVEKQRENRDNQFGHKYWVKKHSIVK